MLQQFEYFMKDNKADTMYIEGIAGTGKTTSLAELVEYCIENKLTSVTCAYTHKAVNVLKSKLPKVNKYNTLCTLHSYLKKCPTIDVTATKVINVEGNIQVQYPENIDVLFIDEFSMIGEKDYKDILTIQRDEHGNIDTKIVYIGDPNQLPPVKDNSIIKPTGKYHVKLTKIYRQADDSKLIDTLLTLNDYLNGKKPNGLPAHEQFIRNTNIVEKYKECNTNKVLLAYTNLRVEELNKLVQGYDKPLIDDKLYSPTLRKAYMLGGATQEPQEIVSIRGSTVELFSKYKTVETLSTIKDVEFYILFNEHGQEETRAVIFGHETYLAKSKQLAKEAVKFNKKIEKQYNEEAKIWAKENWQQPIARDRAKAWKRYLAFKDNVICIDFCHAMTVHKSQGSTYENVFIDTDDIAICAQSSYNLYLKLLYVAISRASDTVYTN